MPKSTHSRIVREGAGLLPDHIAQAQREAAIEQAAEDDFGFPTAADRIESMQQAVVDDVEGAEDDTTPICGISYDHTWEPGDLECRECEADLSGWNDPIDAEAAEVPDDESAGLRIEVTIGSTCACGCGDKTSAGRSFVQGHDQRLIGLLAANHAQEIQFSDGGMLITTSAVGYAARVFSPAGLAKLDRAIDRAKIVPVASRSAVRTTRQAPAEPATALGAEVTVKVGRHTYPATVAGMNQAGKITAVQYVQKTTGATKVAQEGSFSLV